MLEVLHACLGQPSRLLGSLILGASADTHKFAGLAKGSPLMALLQWGGRANVLFAVAACVPEACTSSGSCQACSLRGMSKEPWTPRKQARDCRCSQRGLWH